MLTPTPRSPSAPLRLSSNSAPPSTRAHTRREVRRARWVCSQHSLVASAARHPRHKRRGQAVSRSAMSDAAASCGRSVALVATAAWRCSARSRPASHIRISSAQFQTHAFGSFRPPRSGLFRNMPTPPARECNFAAACPFRVFCAHAIPVAL